MRNGLICLAIMIGFSGYWAGVSAQDVVHEFSWDEAPGYYLKDEDDWLKDELTLSRQATGEVHISACRRHPMWGSGVVFGFQNADESITLQLALDCDVREGEAFVNLTAMRVEGKGGDAETIDRKFGGNLAIDETHDIQLILMETEVILQVGELQISYPVTFEIEKIWETGVGSVGTIRFYKFDPLTG